MIAEDGSPRLTDFGIAYVRDKQRITDTDVLVGTLDYLAPEILDGKDVDPRVDIWAFGVMLFEMLTNSQPFSGNSIVDTLTAILTGPIPDLEQLCPDAPEALVDLIYRMLDKDRTTRIRSVRQVGLELEDILHDRQSDSAIPRSAASKPIRQRPFSGLRIIFPHRQRRLSGAKSSLSSLST